MGSLYLSASSAIASKLAYGMSEVLVTEWDLHRLLIPRLCHLFEKELSEVVLVIKQDVLK